MPKYKLSNGKIIDTTNYSAQKLMFFQDKYPDAVLIEDFQEDPANAETSAGSEKNTVSNWDQDSLATPNTEDPKPIDNVRYIKFKSGAVVYEDEYLDKYAGTERFPASFDDYAAKFKTKPITPSPSAVELEEVLVKAELSPEVKKSQDDAVRYVQTIDSKNEVTLKGEIGIDYFNLTDEYNGIGKLEPKFKRKQQFKTLPDGRKSVY